MATSIGEIYSSEAALRARQQRSLDSLHECSAALRDLQLLDKFVSMQGVPGVWDITMSRGHGSMQATYKLSLDALLPALQSVEAALRSTLARSGYDTSAIPPVCVLTKQKGG